MPRIAEAELEQQRGGASAKVRQASTTANSRTKEDGAMSKIEAIALSFPSLEQADGVCPWDEEAFERWACGPAPCHGAKCAAQFVLTVWDPRSKWACGRFDLIEALCCWDAEHRAAFAQWARVPRWP